MAKLPRSTYYQVLKQAAQPPQAQDQVHQELIREMYHAHQGRYGILRITAALRQKGHLINHKRVERLMKLMGLKGKTRGKKKPHAPEAQKATGTCENLLQRQFEATAPHQKLVSDITEIKVAGQRLFLSAMMDLYNREIIAYEMRTDISFALVGETMNKTFRQLKKHEKPMIHTDQGWHYRMPYYKQALAKRGYLQSMSAKGNCLDNAAMESFFAILKSECVHGVSFASVEELEQSLHAYIHYYNHHRIKLGLNGMSPVQYRLHHAEVAVVDE